MTPAIDAPAGDPVARTQHRITRVRVSTGLAGILGLVVLLVLSIALSLMIGSGSVPLSDVWRVCSAPTARSRGS